MDQAAKRRSQILAVAFVALAARCGVTVGGDGQFLRMLPHVAVELTGQERRGQLSEDSDETLAVKQFSPEWIATLDQRGEPIVYTRENSADFDFLGMPVGGICAGQLYLGGDGKLWCWDIFSTKGKSDVRGVPTHANPYRRSEPDTRAHHQVEQGFAIRFRTNEHEVTRMLDRVGFQNITFRGRYPIGEVTYEDPHMPLHVQLEAFSPFIPLDLDSSTYPATLMIYTVTNTSDHVVSGELLGWLENAVCIESRKTVAGRLRNRVVRTPTLTMVSYDAAAPKPVDASHRRRPDLVFEDFEGDLDKWTAEGEAFEGNPAPNFHHQPLQSFQGKGLADSFRNAGDRNASAGASDAVTGKLTSQAFTIRRKAIRFLIGGGHHDRQTCLNLVVDGMVVRSATGDNNETLDWKLFDVAQLEGKTAHLEIVDAHKASWGHVLVDQIVFSDNGSVGSKSLKDLPDYGSMALGVVGQKSNVKATAVFAVRQPNGWESKESAEVSFADSSSVGAVAQTFTLAPGEQTKIQFVLSWYFPNAPRFPISTLGGRHYGTRFESAADAAEHIVNDLDRLETQTRLWCDTWYNSTLPYWFLDRTMVNTSTLATNTCYLFADGRFYGYEGVYHGHGTCNHVWGYVQAPGRLFPELERRLREMVDYKPGVGFDEESGRIAMRSESNRQDAVDGQSSCIFRTYLTHQMQSDDAYLRRVYPSMKRAMNYLTATYDADRDGVLTGGQHNTLDAKWYGKITWLSLHYTGALRAAAAMAQEMGDVEFARQCVQLADRGRRYIESQLFNGEFFFHEADPEHPDSPGVYDGLEYSQLLGQSWAYQVGLGQILDPDKVRTHLESLWKYNFTTDVGPFREQYRNGRWYAMPGEGGIIACTWPRGGDDVLKLGNQHFAGYLNECQPGYEWAVTSLLMWHGMPYHALAHTRTMHDRYHASRRNPFNEVEWGSHYSRSMASYGVFTAACGMEYHGPRGYLAFSPRLTPENFRAAFTSAQGWGTFSQRRLDSKQFDTIVVRWGRLKLRTIAFDLPADAVAGAVRVLAAGQVIEHTASQDDNRIIIAFSRPATISANESLQVEVTFTQ